SAVVAAAHAAATSRTSTLCILPSVGSTFSKKRASVLNGIDNRYVLSTAPSGSTPQSRLYDRTICSASALVALYKSQGRIGSSARRISVWRCGLRAPNTALLDAWTKRGGPGLGSERPNNVAVASTLTRRASLALR